RPPCFGYLNKEISLMSVPQRGTANPEELEHAPGRERENLEGWIPELASGEEIRAALEKAFDFRGDITLTLKSGEKVEGYIFDRRQIVGPRHSFGNKHQAHRRWDLRDLTFGSEFPGS